MGRLLLAVGLLGVCATSSHVVADTDISTRGYLLSRSQAFPIDKSAELYPELEVEGIQQFLEMNLDLTIRGDDLTFRSDTSALYRVSPTGCRDGAEAPCFVINELYASYNIIPDELLVLVGRYRAPWGSALTFHPAEPMNARPDPTDPTFQRLGAWTALTELSKGNHVVTAAWFPEVEHFEIGAPKDIDYGSVGGRYAWRPEGFDLGLVGFYDLRTRFPQLGGAGSTVLGDSSFEVHGEALIHKRRELEAGNVREGTCPIPKVGFPLRREWDYTALAGVRWDKGDGTLINLEYIHNADGLSEQDYNASLNTKDLLLKQCPDLRFEAADTSEDGRPQQLSGELLRRNYISLSAVKPTFGSDGLLADLGASVAVFTGMDDWSGIVSARITYTRDSIIARLGGLVPFGSGRTQYALLPFHAMMLLDIQLLL